MSKQTYIDRFSILSAAAVGVVMTRTREPHRAEGALREWAFSRQPTKLFKSWNCVRGWREHKPDTRTKAPPDDKTVDAFLALQKISDIAGDGTAAWRDGVFVVHYPHWNLPRHAGMMQLLKEYSRDFTETKQRLVLLVPEEFTLPPELSNDIPILDFDLPIREELREIYTNLMDSVREDTGHATPYSTEDVDVLLSSGAGMTEQEFETALSQAVIQNKAKWPKVPVGEINAILIKVKTEVVKRSEVLEVMEVGSMDDIGGLELAKAWIGKRAVCFSSKAKEFGVDTPKGIAAIGPPGTGKSLLAKGIAGMLRLPLIKFDVAKVFGSLVGQSEQRVASALKMIDAISPAVILLDEIEKAGLDPKQGGGDSGTSMRVLGKILTHMQESKAPIFWVFTANRAHGLDPALLRKGRLDEVFAVLPPNRTERLAVLKIHLRKRKQDPAKIPDLMKAVDASKGFVSAELEAAVKESVIDAFTDGVPVTGALIASQLGNMKPISVAFKEDFQYMKQWAQQNARMSSLSDEDELTLQGEDIPPLRQRRRRMD